MKTTIWIARDLNGTLYAFAFRPDQIGGFYSNYEGAIELDPSLYPEITFETGPVEFELVRKEGEND